MQANLPGSRLSEWNSWTHCHYSNSADDESLLNEVFSEEKLSYENDDGPFATFQRLSSLSEAYANTCNNEEIRKRILFKGLIKIPENADRGPWLYEQMR